MPLWPLARQPPTRRQGAPSSARAGPSQAAPPTPAPDAAPHTRRHGTRNGAAAPSPSAPRSSRSAPVRRVKFCPVLGMSPRRPRKGCCLLQQPAQHRKAQKVAGKATACPACTASLLSSTEAAQAPPRPAHPSLLATTGWRSRLLGMAALAHRPAARLAGRCENAPTEAHVGGPLPTPGHNLSARLGHRPAQQGPAAVRPLQAPAARAFWRPFCDFRGGGKAQEGPTEMQPLAVQATPCAHAARPRRPLHCRVWQRATNLLPSWPSAAATVLCRMPTPERVPAPPEGGAVCVLPSHSPAHARSSWPPAGSGRPYIEPTPFTSGARQGLPAPPLPPVNRAHSTIEASIAPARARACSRRAVGAPAPGPLAAVVPEVRQRPRPLKLPMPPLLCCVPRVGHSRPVSVTGQGPQAPRASTAPACPDRPAPSVIPPRVDTTPRLRAQGPLRPGTAPACRPLTPPLLLDALCAPSCACRAPPHFLSLVCARLFVPSQPSKA